MSQANVTRRSLLKAVAGSRAIGPIAGWSQSGPRASNRPNILLLIADQMHWTMMSGAGNRWLKTPALDSIASTGVRFERAYSANPVCLPWRFSMFTGRFPCHSPKQHRALSYCDPFITAVKTSEFRNSDNPSGAGHLTRDRALFAKR